MQFIDMHCDSLMMAFLKDGKGADLLDSAVVSVDFSRMRQGGQAAQFFAVFLPPVQMYEKYGLQGMEDDTYIAALRGILLDNLERHRDIAALARNAQEIEQNSAAGKLSALLTMEDGRAAGGKLEKLKQFYDQGFRALSLTWNAPNCFGAPNSADRQLMQQGLTAFGKEAVEYMQELGMLVDVSHLSEGGFNDVADLCKKPFAATHSNSRALCPHQRNLSDPQLRRLGQAGGVAGLNFGPEFLNADVSCRDSTARLLASHARHMADVGGVECVGLGGDLDGIGGNLEIDSPAKAPLLVQALKAEGFSEGEIEKIFCKNVLRVLRDAVK